MADIIQIRRDTAANWTASNPVLASGEMGYESNTNKFKFGDGSTAWTSLNYNSIYSFNGRTGAVVPATNDYTWAQINKSTSNIADITTKSHTALTDIGSNTHAQIDTFISSKGANSGLAMLDSGGKVPYSELPSSIMSYLGTWSAATNTPTLADGTGDAGDVYVCNAAGTLNLGSGSLTFAIGDWCIYNGTIWQKSLNSNAVTSVNGYTGTIILVKSDIGLANVTNDAQLKIASNLSDLNNTTTAKTNLSLNNVENTALSTWAGTSNITTLGTITNGTWHGTGIANAYLANSGILASTAANGFQISAVSLGGTFALTTPQDLRTTAMPTFAGMTLAGALAMGSNTITSGAITSSGISTFNSIVSLGGNTANYISLYNDGTNNRFNIAGSGNVMFNYNLGVAKTFNFYALGGTSPDFVVNQYGNTLAYGSFTVQTNTYPQAFIKAVSTQSVALDFIPAGGTLPNSYRLLSNTPDGTFNLYDITNAKYLLTVSPNTGNFNLIENGTITSGAITSSGNIKGASITPMNLTTGYLPYKSSTTLVNSPIYTDGTNVGIGTTSPNANAIVDMTSTTKAFMPPRMTTTQKNAIPSPTSGMMVYDSTLNKLCVYGASSWETITSI